MDATSFVSIRLSTLKGTLTVPFNVYVRVNRSYFPFIQQGDGDVKERLKKLRDKNVKKIFIRIEEETIYRNFLNQAIEMAFDDSSGQPIEQRAELVQGVVESQTEAIYENPSDPTHYNNAQKNSAKYVRFLLNEHQAIQAMLTVDNPDSNLVTHGITVATMAVALAQRLGLNAEETLQKLAFGALLHDLGHNGEEYDLNRALTEFNQDELFLYHQHPQRAVDILTAKQSIDPTVLRIIQQHEERIDGSGFPNSLHEAQTDPLAVIVASCNTLDRIITFEKTPRNLAIKKLLIDQVGLHPLNHIQLLQEILNETLKAK